MFKIVFIAASFLCTTLSFAQEVRSFSIEEAKAYALENHLTVRNADNDIEIARKKIVETRGIGLPRFCFKR